ncbi:hypothetical protein ABT382_28080 [Streptomyces pharetrae]|uniref:hypothetical protein n=1 Tax=Streptomyces pharetrae TaxID=291370 RepID=UPI00334AE985
MTEQIEERVQEAHVKTAILKRRAGGSRKLAAVGALLGAMMLSFTSATPVSAAEQKVRVGFYSGDWNLTFDGTVKPDGPTRYTYDGYLYADCPPGRFPAPRIALGHGAVSRGWQIATAGSYRKPAGRALGLRIPA